MVKNHDAIPQSTTLNGDSKLEAWREGCGPEHPAYLLPVMNQPLGVEAQICNCMTAGLGRDMVPIYSEDQGFCHGHSSDEF